jgi:putative copper resistance protein D
VIAPETALVAARFGGDLAALFLWGAAAYLWLLVPPNLSARIWPRLRWWRVGALVLAVLAAISVLPAQGALLGSGWAEALDIAMLQTVATETSAGTAWIWQATAVAVLCLFGIAPLRLQFPVTTLASAGLLFSLTMTGHAAMHDGPVGLAHRANDLLHVLAGGAWLGALVPVLLMLRELDHNDAGSDARIGLSRFSLAGHGAVALVLLSGLANTLLILGQLPTDWSKPYQFLLSMKILLVVLMVMAAVFNRYYLVPRLARSLSASRALAVGTLAEIVTSVVVIALVAWFGTLDPFGV